VRTGTDFALSFPGSASGTVFSVTNAAPIAGAVVEFVSTGGDSLRAMTQANGDYSIQMPPGIWSATIEHASSHLRLQWANLPCTFGCPAATGTPIAIAASANTANIDFALTLGGSISGFTGIGTSTTDFPGVLVFAADGTLVEDTGVATASAYRTRVGLPSGEYFVRSFGCATAATGLCVHRIFAFVPCELDCNPLTGDPVGVVAGADTASINLSIHLGCRIRAQVREYATHRELPLARIQVFDSSGALVRDSQVDPETSGYNIDPLRAVNLGQYFVKVSSPAHVDELYDNIACEDGCAVTAGTPVVCNGSFDLNLSISLAPIDEVFASGFE
jgi:hypothetical protein